MQILHYWHGNASNREEKTMTYRNRRRSQMISMDAIVGVTLLLASAACLWAYVAFALSHDCKFIQVKSTGLQHMCSIVGY
jgi:hypothetical protein